MKFKFIHAPKPKQFEYKPRHYDPAQEERDAKKRELLGDDYKEDEGEYRPGQYISQLRIRRGIVAEREKNKRKQRRTLRSIIFLVLLLLLAWWMMTSEGTSSIWDVLLQSKK